MPMYNPYGAYSVQPPNSLEGTIPVNQVRVLDLFCGDGGCSAGYARGGLKVTGVDINPMPRYVHGPKNFIQADAMQVLFQLVKHGKWADTYGTVIRLTDYDVIHASPPCQGYSATQRFNPDMEYPKLIEPVREALRALQRPYIIENVETAPLYATVTLCGGMFPKDELKVYRHRIFECSFHVPQPVHNPHLVPQAKMGRPPKDGEFMHVVGHFPSMDYAKKAMGIDWMRRDELAEAIPPAYTYYLSPYARAAALECKSGI